MTQPHVDTDVLVRYVTGDDPAKQAAAAALLERVAQGDLALRAPLTVVANAVHVLSSRNLYAMSRPGVAEALLAIVEPPEFLLDDKSVVLRALEVFGSTRLDFGDAMIVASMELRGATVVYSYDTDFDRIPGLNRRPPS